MLNWFRRKPAPDPWSLDRTLFAWNKYDDKFTIRDACSGVAVFGATGSGKTSGSGHLLATSYLKAGFGFLVLCTKSDERALWEKHCRDTCRAEDLIVFSPDNDYRFNAIDYERLHGGRGGLTLNLVRYIEEILEMANGREKGAGGQGEDGYWLAARQQLLLNAVDLLVLSDETISVPNIYEIIASAPRSEQQLGNRDWQNSSYCFHRMLVMLDRAQRGQIGAVQLDDSAKVARYFQKEYVKLAEKTRSIIDSTFCSAASVLDRSLLKQLFSTTTNVSPLDIFKGKIIVVDLPVESTGIVGLFAGILWKRSAQLSILRRAIGPGSRPVCIWADEAQSFITGTDASFLSICRSKLACNVYLSQNINNYTAALGAGDKAAAEVDSVLGNALTLIAHANSCPKTGEYLSERIGRERQFLSNFSQSGGPSDWYGAMTGEDDQNETAGFSEAWEYQLQPSFYGTLRTGGHQNRRIVDAVVYTTGRQFRSTGKNWMLTTMQQV